MAITLHEGQSEIFESLMVDQTYRFVVDVCSRGWGKSYLACACATTAVFELLELDWRVPNKNVAIIAPTFDQVTDIYYPMLTYEFGLDAHTVKPPSKDTGRFLFDKNVELRLMSYEAVERMRGKGYYFVVWDEPASCVKGISPKSAWEGIIQPTIVTRWSKERARIYKSRSPGRALVIGTPKGYTYFYDMFNFRDADEEWGSYQHDYTKSPLLDVEEIERIRHTLDPIEFASEYLASFADSGNSVFYCFKREIHVRKDIEDFQPPKTKLNGDIEEYGEDVHCFIDFNVGLQCTSFAAIRGGQVHIIEEFKGHPDTETLAIAIATKFRGHKIYAYPDPSGRAAKTSAPVGRTDFSILESYGIRCLARPKAPPISDSVQAVNMKLMTAAGDVGLYIHPRCQGVINSLERTKWVDKNPDTATIDKSEGVEHYSDGIRYGIEYKFPVRSGTKTVSRGFKF
jgi:hypothetical protein